DLVTKYNKLGFEVLIESSAGEKSGIHDDEFRKAGATIISNIKETITDVDIITKVQSPDNSDLEYLAHVKSGCILVGMLNPYFEKDKTVIYGNYKISAFAAELFPRITRA